MEFSKPKIFTELTNSINYYNNINQTQEVNFITRFNLTFNKLLFLKHLKQNLSLDHDIHLEIKKCKIKLKRIKTQFIINTITNKLNQILDKTNLIISKNYIAPKIVIFFLKDAQKEIKKIITQIELYINIQTTIKKIDDKLNSNTLKMYEYIRIQFIYRNRQLEKMSIKHPKQIKIRLKSLQKDIDKEIISFDENFSKQKNKLNLIQKKIKKIKENNNSNKLDVINSKILELREEIIDGRERYFELLDIEFDLELHENKLINKQILKKIVKESSKTTNHIINLNNKLNTKQYKTIEYEDNEIEKIHTKLIKTKLDIIKKYKQKIPEIINNN